MSDRPPGWNAALQVLGPRLRRYLAYHHFALREQHEDLVQAALADTLAYLNALPAPGVEDEDEVARIGFTILKRRVADAFRDNAKQWALKQSGDPDEPTTDDATESLDYKRTLRTVIELMATLEPRERDLIAGAALGQRLGRPHSDAERKALSRARASLKAKLWTRHRIDLDRFLNEGSP
jgi:DNA-directed RNA polymerase specialized sigma24 family protein